MKLKGGLVKIKRLLSLFDCTTYYIVFLNRCYPKLKLELEVGLNQIDVTEVNGYVSEV